MPEQDDDNENGFGTEGQTEDEDGVETGDETAGIVPEVTQDTGFPTERSA